MPAKPNWVTKSLVEGIWEVRLSSWRHFQGFLIKEMLEYSHFVWRGQRDSKWGLETSLDRLLKNSGKQRDSSLVDIHLENFKYATRGRRGINPARIDSENEWWALGQHYGLATPLLDWTESSFVSLYFAFQEDVSVESGFRSVWALGAVDDINRKIFESTKKNSKPNVLEMVRPHLDENHRSLNQAGLFTRVPFGETVETWVKKNHLLPDEAILLKLYIPDEDRDECLQTLNKMNINHLTLFPDLFGSGQHCNQSILIDDYWSAV